MNVQAPILEQDDDTSVSETLNLQQDSSSSQNDHLAALDRSQLQQHIQSLQQKLARQKAKQSCSLFSIEQQKQLLQLLEKRSENDSTTTQLQGLVQRAIELNQQSEKVQQDILGLNIVSENATNKCFETTYNAQHVIDQNEKQQKSLSRQVEKSIDINEQSEQLAEDLSRKLEQTALSQQKMKLATERTQSVSEKSTQLLEELTQCRESMLDQVNLVRSVIETSNHTNGESEHLQKLLNALKLDISKNIDDHQLHMEASNEVLNGCRTLAHDVKQEKQATARLLKEVASGNVESQDLAGKMNTLIEEGEDKRQENRKLNLELQHSLQRNQQQREDLVVLTSECRETRDASVETQSKHETSIRDALEQLSISLASNKQSKFQVDRVLKDLLDSNGISGDLIERMTDLSKDAEVKQRDNGRLNIELEDTLARSINCRDDLVEIADDCRVVRDKTKSVLEASEQINGESQTSIVQLNEHIDSMSITKLELNGIIETAKQINNDTSESLDSMRTNINNSSLIQKESMRLNKESVATTLGAKRATEKLTEELDASVKLNQHFQDRLKQAEKKYLNAIEAEKKYQEMHESGLKALQENESLLAEARASLNDYSENTIEYNNTVKQFQQTTIQSQQVILETQSSIKTLLNSNEALAEETRFLKSQLQEREIRSPSNVLPMPKAEKKSATVGADAEASQLEKYGIYRSDWQLES